MNAHSSGRSGLPYSAHPARTGKQVVIAPHVEQRHLADDRAERSGRRTSMLPIKRPPLLPPWVPRCGGEVTLRRMRSTATAMKSS